MSFFKDFKDDLSQAVDDLIPSAEREAPAPQSSNKYNAGYLKDEEVSGEFSRALDDAVNAVKASEERRREYMWLNMRDNELRAEGREEGRKEGQKEGRKEGMVFQAIKMYRDLASLNDSQIIQKIMQDFQLSQEQAESYLQSAFA